MLEIQNIECIFVMFTELAINQYLKKTNQSFCPLPSCKYPGRVREFVQTCIRTLCRSVSLNIFVNIGKNFTEPAKTLKTIASSTKTQEIFLFPLYCSSLCVHHLFLSCPVPGMPSTLPHSAFQECMPKYRASYNTSIFSTQLLVLFAFSVQDNIISQSFDMGLLLFPN